MVIDQFIPWVQVLAPVIGAGLTVAGVLLGGAKFVGTITAKIESLQATIVDHGTRITRVEDLLIRGAIDIIKEKSFKG